MWDRLSSGCARTLCRVPMDIGILNTDARTEKGFSVQHDYATAVEVGSST